MNRRTLLQIIVSTSPVLPFTRVRLGAQTRAFTPEALVTLNALGRIVLPREMGVERIDAFVSQFVTWTRNYQEGVPTSHGYGHPRLERTPASPVPDYVAQLAALEGDAKALGKPLGDLTPDQQRQILDKALTAAGVRGLPPRPTGQHIVSDLMGFYFRSGEALNRAYHAAIGRQTCRPIQITTERPAPLV
jgi:hypothetical protein